MLIVVFGAGASFDSNPAVPTSTGHDDRPPLANSLFEMDRGATREAAAAFPRAAPALMAARADVRAGGTIEATLARLQDASGDDPEARSQLMAVRFYLQRVVTVVPDAWDAHAVRQTTYVSMLDQLRRWQRATGQRLVLVTFNYDLLLERACEVVLGHRFDGMASYQSRADLHLFKPHGSVDWARPARWEGSGYGDQDAARRAVCDSPDLAVHDDYAQRSATADVIEQAGGTSVAWLPALAIPVERKPDVVMPLSHSAALRADLEQATAVLCVGWRAREEHFLRVLQDALPAGPVPLYAVAETRDAAMETVDNVWATGRFGRFAAIGGGFSHFAEPEPTPGPPDPGRLLLRDVLRGTAPTSTTMPGTGVETAPPGLSLTLAPAPYTPFAGPGHGDPGRPGAS